MKFKYYLEHITGVSIYPMVSLLIFIVFFTALTVWALKAKKSYITEVKNIPLGNNNDNN
ncbi:MAG: CcoQ/FixQ family Cbb3-type cytochrome c oxidase assembly chaperone [Bacteroidetes bacterium]|nr:CcoQ/FixQ family Cbb3-type cytochrome c oxidase assembly chaperone [Bacteroidota bacterium]